MQLHTMKAPAGANKRMKRVGRGESSGHGKTAGRGGKGQTARTGKGKPGWGFEGGQNPLMQRLPKLRGFKSQYDKPELVNLSDLAKIKGVVDNVSVFEAGIISSSHTKAKLIGNGMVEGKHEVKLQFATKSAIAAVKKAGGSVTIVDQFARIAKITDDSK